MRKGVRGATRVEVDSPSGIIEGAAALLCSLFHHSCRYARSRYARTITHSSARSIRDTAGMTERTNSIRTSLRLLALVCLSCAISCKLLVAAQPPLLRPDFTYGDLVAADPESLMLLNRLKQVTEQKHRVVEQEHEITDEQINLEAMLQAKAMELQRNQSDYPAEEPEPEAESEPEALPVPAAMIQRGGQQQPTSGKRKPNTGVTYMSLCHFKICNMGRKRQSH